MSALAVFDGPNSQGAHPAGGDPAALVHVTGFIPVVLAVAGAVGGISRWRQRGSATMPFWLMVATLAVFFGWLTLAIIVLQPGA